MHFVIENNYGSNYLDSTVLDQSNLLNSPSCANDTIITQVHVAEFDG